MAIKGPLSGVRILDLSQAHAGPWGSQLLADLGAEVIKIETPLGDLTRQPMLGKSGGYYILALNRNKKGIVLDLWTKTGKEAFLELVKISDVVYDNFRVGAMDRMGLSDEKLREVNPKLITASICGYGSSGPYATYPSYDDVAQAMSGIAGLCGDPEGAPMRSGAAVADICAGIFCTYGIVAALFERERTGVGRRVEVNLLDTCMALLDNMFEYYFFFGRVPPRQGSRHPLMALLGYYKTKDGYIAIGPSWPRICRVINKEWMIEDDRFKDQVSRLMNKQTLEDELESALQEHDTATWIELMRVEDIPCSPVNTLDQVLEDPQVKHNNIVLEMEHPEYGPVKAVGCPIKILGTCEGTNDAPPTLGEHTDEVLKSLLGYSDEKIAALKKEQEENVETMKTHARKVLA